MENCYPGKIWWVGDLEDITQVSDNGFVVKKENRVKFDRSQKRYEYLNKIVKGPRKFELGV